MAISDEISRLQTAKTAIKLAISLKGVEIPEGVTISYYDQYISQITGGGGELEIKQVTPTATGSIVRPSEGYSGMSQVILNGDLNLVPQNVKEGVTIFGVTGTLEEAPEPRLQTKSVTPTASGTTVTFDSGYDGLEEVTVNGDGNLVPDNIRKGATVFGVTGSYAGAAAGSGKYNVYVQGTEPDDTNGVWLKGSGGNGKVVFTPDFSKTGNFVNENFSYLNPTATLFGQVAIGDYLYSFGNNSSNSFKYNLRTKQKVGNLNVPSTGSTVFFGATYNPKTNKIFVMYQSGAIAGYMYDIKNNTYKTIPSSGTTPTRCYSTYNSLNVYNDILYVLVRSYSGSNYTINSYKFNADTGAFISNKEINRDGNGFYNSQCYAHGKYISYLEYGTLKMFDCSTETFTNKALVSSSSDLYTKYGYPNRFVVNGDEVVLFLTKYGVSNIKEYAIYNLSTNSLKTISTNITYNLYNHNGMAIVVNEISGQVFFRQSGYDTLMFQMNDHELDGISDGSVVILQNLTNDKLTQIDDDSRLYIGVQDVFMVKNGKLEDTLSFYGDGNQWLLLKNPTEEVTKVTFDTAGGSTIDELEVVIGSKISKPSESPTKSGYVFDYWELDGKPYDFSQPVIKSITLTAVWTSYEQIEFIESTGTQYIDTGIVPNSTTRMVLDVAMSDLTNNNRNGWGSTGGAEAFFCGTVNTKSVFFAAVGADWTNTDFETTIDNERHVFDISNGAIMLDNKSYGTGNIGNTATTGQTLYIFALHTEYVNGSIYYQGAKEKLYSCKIYDQGVLVRDYVPIKTEDGVYALFDKVNNVVYANAGTGSFTGGNEETPVFLSHIESTGTQYIDTGVVPNSTTLVKTQVEFTTTSQQTYAVVAGTQNNENGTNAFLMFCTNSLNARTGDGGNIVTGLNVETGKTFELELKFNEYKVNGISYNGELTWTTDITGTLYLMARHCPAVSGGLYPDSMAKIKMKQFQIYDNGELVRNLMPYRDEYGVICMYDTVNNKKYYNAGTGTFTGE